MIKTNPNRIKERFRLAISNWGFSKEGFINNKNGEWWLILQLFLITCHLLPAYPSHSILEINWTNIFKIIGVLIFIIGSGEAIKALVSLGGSLSPLPQPKQGAVLVTNNSYKHCRHPLYRSIIITSLGTLITLGSLIHLLLFVLLSLTLVVKAKREENSLKLKYSNYEDYIRTTPAIFSIGFFDWRT